MTNEQKAVKEFHIKHGHLSSKYASRPKLPSSQLLLLRCRLIVDEAAEFLAACSKRDLVEAVDALADLLYVVYGAGETLGVDLEPVFSEVHRSNMTKEVGYIDASGKSLKSSAFTPPDVEKVLRSQGWDSSECC